MDYMIGWIFYRSIMPRYFSLSQKDSTFHVKCRICDFKHQGNEMWYLLEYHILFKHPGIIEDIRNEIRRLDLVKYFMFDVELSRIRCVVCNALINIFWGPVGLNQHLIFCHRIAYWYK